MRQAMNGSAQLRWGLQGWEGYGAMILDDTLVAGAEMSISLSPDHRGRAVRVRP